MNGVINVLKPPGMTSHDVVQFIKRLLGLKRAGHTGTLDPEVPGVLPVCLEKGTRIGEFIVDMTKAYRAQITFGATSDTGDWTGNLTLSREINDLLSNEREIRQRAESLLKGLVGEVELVPPEISAVHINGKRSYKLARQGVAVKLKPRIVTVHSVTVIGWEEGSLPTCTFDIECSKGTYIRSICSQTGKKLGYGAYMSFLVRTRSGPFRIEDSLTLEELSSLRDEGRIESAVAGIESVLADMPALELMPSWVQRVRNGMQPVSSAIRSWNGNEGFTGPVRLVDQNGFVVAIADVSTPARGSGPVLKLRKVLM